ncbi:formate dehydrogenase accessory sulfurtransferase FdhD [Effusibacillus lacus]|uniref:Formate dehydrogenase family accessory protein FdhD n=1 Tax=Effusibacillus lacus TaxID=1348429 RepID=A0A292YLH9_9BACL|nr:formate dehydrogenase accessory sulfurtransferase FdhD [Effusibacillus lacus]TCS71809.1 FdhD protein [Effusibacillus lacus]GAX89623.1 formate dehydrogenase family accessory protein FdhD [Effusibacillus lacus]
MLNKTPPDEYPVTLYVNGYELATYQLTKQDLQDWVIGQLFNEKLIQSPGDIHKLRIEEGRGKIWADLHPQANLPPGWQQQKKHYTAGCGKGATFLSISDIRSFKKVRSRRSVTCSYLTDRMQAFTRNSPLYLRTGGMHGACLVDMEGKIHVREDIGRHNAVDKVIGYALQKELHPETLILLTTGRISYEMLAKAARFGIGIVGSRTAATRQALQLANYLQIDVAGYIRGKMVQIYTSHGRIINDHTQKVAAE